VPEYVLPDLPYDDGALEPHISGRIMELHHDEHHQTHVTGANTALEELAEARENDGLGTADLHEKNLASDLAGHVNHSVSWPNTSPEGGDRPDGELAAAITDQFGSSEALQAHLTAVATGVQGSARAQARLTSARTGHVLARP
jgi:superoxide dismutase, Fe-Mn family